MKNKVMRGDKRRNEKLIAGKFTKKEVKKAVKSFDKTTYPAMKRLADE